MLQYSCYIVRDRKAGPVTTLYEEQRNSVDVLFVGSSHVYHNINTLLLWREHGIAAFNIGGRAQPLWASYYYLKEACKYQSPKIVAIDVLSISGYWKDDYWQNSTGMQNELRKNVQDLRGLDNRIGLIESSVPNIEKFSFYFDLFQYHSRVKSLDKESFVYAAEDAFFKGFSPFTGIKPPPKVTDVSEVEDELELSPKHLEYIHKLYELSKENNFSLVFIKAPYVFDTSSILSPQDQKRRYNAMRGLADEYGIPFLDFNTPEYNCGIDWETDTYDAGAHLNIDGAEKFTDALGAYLSAHYDLPDRRGDPAYVSWDEAYEKYLSFVKAEQLKKVTVSSDYFAMLKDPNYLTIFTSCGTGIDKCADNIQKGFAHLGLTPPAGTGDSYVAILDGTRVDYQETGKGLLEYASEDLGIRIHAKSAGQRQGEKVPAPQSSVFIDGESLSANKDGLNIVIFDKRLRKMVDRCWIASKADNKIVR